MKKVLSVLHKAHDEKNGDVPFHGLVTELLRDESPTHRRRSTLRSRKKSPRLPTAQNGPAPAARIHPDERLVALHYDQPSAAEQYHKLHIEIVRAGQVRKLRTLLITSALTGEGKTTTALNLAIAMAASGGEGQVLLVETDFRRPGIQKYLSIHAEGGLVDYLRGDIDSARLFTPTSLPGLTIVPMGRPVQNPVALVTCEKMTQFFREVKAQHYRYILLDSSPILLTSEVKVLALHAEAALLVVRAGKTPQDMVVKAIDILGRENILGCVFNSMAASDSHAYRYYYNAQYFTPRP